MWKLAAVAPGPAAWVLAQVGNASRPELWAVGSALGAFLVTLLSGKVVVPTFAYSRERDRADRLEAEVGRLHAENASRVIPALEAQSVAIRESSAMVKEAIAALGRRRT